LTVRTAQINKEEQALQDFDNPDFERRRIFAETWGTFLLVLVAAAGKVLYRKGQISLGMAVTAPGLMVMSIIYFLGSVSGAHVNPAVTLAFALRRNFPWRRVPGYIGAQLLGAILAAVTVYIIFGQANRIGASIPGDGIDVLRALLVEIILTAALVNIVLGTACGPRNVGPNGGIAIGGYIVLAGLWADQISGASMNPARSLAPDIIRWNFETTWIYVAGPLIGAAIGVMFEWIIKGTPTEEGSESAQGKGK
jgi:aquaporin Z